MTTLVERASDMDYALMLAGHIDNPCSVTVDGRIEHIRPFYLREAERAIPLLENPYAQNFLRLKIAEYQPK